MKKILRKETLLILIISLLPLLSAYIGLFRKGYGFHDILPYWSDEANYYHIIESMLDYGMPLGYNGYNGSSAIIGTFGFHGFFVLLPYFLFAKMFGLYSFTIAICNIFLVTVALIVYKVIVKPKNKDFLIVSIFVSFAPLIMTFYTINMLEGLNICFAILLAACFIRLIHDPSKKIFIYSFLLIVFATLCKVTWGVSMLPWFILFIKGHPSKKIVLASVLTIVFILLNYFLFYLVSAPYFDSQVMMLINLLKGNGLWHGGFIMIQIFLKNLIIPFQSGMKINNVLLNITSITFILIIVFQLVLLSYFAIRKLLKKDVVSEHNKVAWISLWLFFSTYFGVSFLYSASIVALRTLYPILTCSVLLYMYSIKIPRIHVAIALVTVISFIIVLKNDIYYDPRVFASKAYEEQFVNQRKYMQDNMNIDVKADRWDNTIAAFLNVPFSYWEAAPSGSGYNLYKDIPKDVSQVKAKYILVKSDDEIVMNAFLIGGYKVHATDGVTNILMKN